MKPQQIFDIMDLARRARQKNFIFNPCFTGAPGLGKTEIMQQWCKERGLLHITWTSALLEPPDVRGFPQVTTVNGKQRQTTALPDLWPDSNSATEGVVILEELNRGTTSIMNCWMGLSDVRRGFDNYTLPPGWIVAACINPEDPEYDTNTMDPALKDRFEFFQVNYDKESFIQFMKTNNWDESVIMFIDSGTWTYSLPGDVGNAAGNKYLAPRTYSKLNAALQAGIAPEHEQMVYESILGKNVGLKFYHFKHKEQPVLYRDLVTNTREALARLTMFADPKNYRQGHISITMKNIIEDSTIEDQLLMEVVTTLPADQSVVLIRELEYKRAVPTSSIYNRLVTEYPQVKKYFKATMKK
jgi:hypothetical protein